MTPIKRRRLLRWLLGLACLYVVVGFFVAPLLIKAIVLWQLPQRIDRQVSLAKIKLNPFTFSVAIDGFAIAERDGTPFVGWDEVYVDYDPTGLFSRELVVSQVSISNAFGHIQINQDRSFNFSDILEKFPSDPAPPTKPAGKPMTVRVGQLRITGSHFVYDDLTHAKPFHTAVGPVNVTLNNFSTDPSNKNPYGFTATTESGEKLTWRGVFTLDPIQSSGDFSVEGITLKKYAPYYDDFVSLSIHDGTLDLQAHYRIELTDHLTVAQVSNLTVRVQALKIGPSKSDQTFLALPELTIADTFFDLTGHVVNVGTFSTRGARYEVERLKDGSLNLVNLLAPPPSTNAPAPSTSTNAPTAWVATVRNISIEDWGFHVTGFLGEQRLQWSALRFANIVAQANPVSLSIDSIALEQPKIEIFIPAGLTNSATETASAPNTNPPAPPPPFAVGSILITNAALEYRDASLATPASLTISQLNVLVTGLSTEAKTRADLRVSGRVGHLGNLDATGRINPLNIDAATELQAALTHMDLTPFGPYAGKYAGYDLRKGKLSVAVKYAIDQRKLTAQNTIEVDQFTFGEATGSPDAVKLPVKLAVAILKDINGQIKLDVPVEGRIDDPKFRYWGAVWHVLGGLFTKIFTAPFGMLGSMFGGGGEELGYQEFAPGSAELIANQTQKLDVLIKALAARPSLNLELTGSIDPVKDIEPLKRQKLDQLLLTKRAAGNTNALTQTERAAYLREVYAEALPRLAPPPAQTNFSSNINNVLVPGAKPVKAGSQAKKAAAELTVEEMETQYLPLIELIDADYRQLATARGASVVKYLKDKAQIADDRLFIATNPLKQGSRVVIGLQ